MPVETYYVKIAQFTRVIELVIIVFYFAPMVLNTLTFETCILAHLQGLLITKYICFAEGILYDLNLLSCQSNIHV